MHEESVVRVLLEEVGRQRDAHGAARVSTVWVEAGVLSGVEPELFRLAFERLAPERLGALCRIELTSTPLTLECDQCGAISSCDEVRFRCTGCGSASVAVRGGDRVILDRVELVIDDARGEPLSVSEAMG